MSLPDAAAAEGPERPEGRSSRVFRGSRPPRGLPKGPGVALTADDGRQSKMGSAIDVVWRSWDDFDADADPATTIAAPSAGGGAVDGDAAAGRALLAASPRKTRLSPYSPTQTRSPYSPRRPSTTLWDLKDARASLAGLRPPRSPRGPQGLPAGRGELDPASAAAAVTAASLDAEHTGIKVYKRRWLMLAIFIFLGAANTFQWVQYSIIANIVQRYYGVSLFLVDLTCMSFLIAYLLFFIPASWFLDKHVSGD